MKYQCIGMNRKDKIEKTEGENKNTTNEYRYFVVSNFVGVNRLFALSYSYADGNAKRYKSRRYYLPKGVIKN